MPLIYRDAAKMDRRRAVTLDKLASEDSVVQCGYQTLMRRLDITEPFGPPKFRAPSEGMLDYVNRKRKLVRAEYFRQRYGRDYWTSRQRHPNRIRKPMEDDL